MSHAASFSQSAGDLVCHEDPEQDAAAFEDGLWMIDPDLTPADAPPVARSPSPDVPLTAAVVDDHEDSPRPSKPPKQKDGSSLHANQKSRQKKKALRIKAKTLFAAADDAVIDFDDMDGQNAATKKDKLDVMNKVIEDRDVHEGWMREAIEMAELALRSDETPVGCVFACDGKIIARGMNGTNATLNGTRHAEFVALSQIIAQYPLSILQKTDLYVTVEPCIMCASALRQFRIRAVYFGCLNERFGGCGGVMRLNSDPGVDPPYVVYGGLFREEAIMLLRRFYVQENEKAPEPKPKKNRELKTEILPVEVAHAGNPPPVPALPLTLNSKQTVIPHVPPPVPVAVLQTVSEGNVPMLPPPSPVAAVPAENVAQASLTAAEEAPQSRSKSDMASLAERVREITLDIGKKMSVPAKKENVKEPSSNKENVKELSIKENVKQSSTTDKVKQPSKTLPNDAKLPLQSPPGGREPSSPDRIAAARQA